MIQEPRTNHRRSWTVTGASCTQTGPSLGRWSVPSTATGLWNQYHVFVSIEIDWKTLYGGGGFGGGGGGVRKMEEAVINDLLKIKFIGPNQVVHTLRFTQTLGCSEVCRLHYDTGSRRYFISWCRCVWPTRHKKASNHHANLPLEMYSFTL